MGKGHRKDRRVGAWEAISQSCLNQSLIAVLTCQLGWRAQREMHVLMGGQKGHQVPPSLLWELGGWWDSRVPYHRVCKEHFFSTLIMTDVNNYIFCYFSFACVSEIRSHCIAQAGLALRSPFHGAEITVVCHHSQSVITLSSFRLDRRSLHA